MELRQLRSGLIVRLLRRSGFKLGVVLGSAPSGKVRLCVWSSNRGTWSQPQSVPLKDLESVSEYLEKISLNSARIRRRTISKAMEEIASYPDQHGRFRVRYKGGESYVSSPAIELLETKLPPEGVTRLTAPLRVTDDDRKQLQNLNRRLGSVLGGRR